MTVTAVAPDIYQVRLPLPFALNHVNCYLLRGPDGWAVVDTGLHTPAGEAGWRAAFAELAIDPAEISRIVLTHFHPDHFGMAGWLQQLSGAPVLLSPRDIDQAERVWHKPADLPEPTVALLLAHGTPADLAAQIADLIGTLRAATRPAPDLTPLEPGDILSVGGRRLVALDAPGHSEGQLMFHDPEARLILCGDHVLIKITPHIGLWPESEPDPLGRYLASLAGFSALEIALALPGHGPLIEDWSGRLAALRQHHEERLDLMLEALGAAATAWEVANRVFAFARFSPHEMRFAVAETIAHLEQLVVRGQLARDEGELIVYTR